jgi:hypothetical protein
MKLIFIKKNLNTFKDILNPLVEKTHIDTFINTNSFILCKENKIKYQINI